MPFISKMIPKGSVPFGIILGMIVLLGSCRTQYVAMPAVHQRDSLATRVNKYVDSIYIDRTHTESFLHGTTTTQKTTDWGLSLISSFRVDTLLVKDSIYVEKYTDIEVHDTVVVTRRDSVPYPVEVPVEVPTPIPRFYRNCTIGFWLIIMGIILIIVTRLYLRR